MSIKVPYLHYSPLDQSQESIRLLDIFPGTSNSPIHCRIRHATLTSSPTYSAVSYTWGRKTRSSRLLWVDGKPCHLRPSLWALIQGLRHPHELKTLWIDAFSIDQSNVSERNHQVHLMGKIYSGAAQVLVWLGHMQDDSNIAFDFMNQVAISRGSGHQDHHDIDISQEAANAVSLLCHRDYWFRAWIRQEIILARSIALYCGDRMTQWESFAYVCTELMAKSLTTSPVLQLITQQSAHDTQKFQPLEKLLRRYGHSQASDRRDRVYALLALASDRGNAQGLAADYSLSMADLFDKVMQHCNQRHDPEFVKLLSNMLLPDEHHLQRLRDVETLSQLYIHSGDVQLRLNSRLLLSVASDYTAMKDPTQYLNIKSRVVWKIIAVHHPKEPRRFQAIFKGLSKLDQAPPNEVARSRALQAMIDQSESPLSSWGRIHSIYPVIDKLCARHSTGPSGLVTCADAFAARVFWDLLTQQWLAAYSLNGLLDFSSRLEQVLELRESPRILSIHHNLFDIRSKHLHVQALRILTCTTTCDCSDTDGAGGGLCCPVDDFATFWVVVALIWPLASTTRALKHSHHHLLQQMCSLYSATRPNILVIDQYDNLRELLLAPPPTDDPRGSGHHLRIASWYQNLKTTYKNVSHRLYCQQHYSVKELVKELAGDSPNVARVFTSDTIEDNISCARACSAAVFHLPTNYKLLRHRRINYESSSLQLDLGTWCHTPQAREPRCCTPQAQEPRYYSTPRSIRLPETATESYSVIQQGPEDGPRPQYSTQSLGASMGRIQASHSNIGQVRSRSSNSSTQRDEAGVDEDTPPR
jgi:hypothetical protein